MTKILPLVVILPLVLVACGVPKLDPEAQKQLFETTKKYCSERFDGDFGYQACMDGRYYNKVAHRPAQVSDNGVHDPFGGLLGPAAYSWPWFAASLLFVPLFMLSLLVVSAIVAVMERLGMFRAGLATLFWIVVAVLVALYPIAVSWDFIETLVRRRLWGLLVLPVLAPIVTILAFRKIAYPALYVSARRGDVHGIASQLQSGSDPEKRTWYGLTALHGAADRSRVAAVRALIEGGADPNAEATSFAASGTFDWALTALHRAARKGHVDVLDALVSCGADVARVDTLGRTPLYEAATNGKLQAVRTLLDYGADVEAAISSATQTLESDGEEVAVIRRTIESAVAEAKTIKASDRADS